MNTDQGFLDVEVVLVCDPVDDGDSSIDAFSSNGDRPGMQSFDLIRAGLEKAASRVVCYNSISQFIDNIGGHRHAVVFPYWFGELSRSRHALLPATCEAYGIPYVGADAYTKIVCNDKHLSKTLCKDAGFRSAHGLVLWGPSELTLLRGATYPAVVKPAMQGSSLGIEDDSLVQSSTDAERVARRIGERLGWPILCEQFVGGAEVSICLVGDHVSPPDIRAISWACDGDQAFLDDRIFTYSLKYLQGLKFTKVDMAHVLTQQVREASERLFMMLDKAEVMRIDGRLTDRGFTVLELTPDLDMRPDGEVATAFNDRFGSYPAMLRHLLTNSLKRFRRQAPMHDEDEVVMS